MDCCLYAYRLFLLSWVFVLLFGDGVCTGMEGCIVALVLEFLYTFFNFLLVSGFFRDACFSSISNGLRDVHSWVI